MDNAQPAGQACCEELEAVARVSRRRLFAGVTAASAGVTTASLFGDVFRQASFAATVGAGANVVVVLSLRGGIDGMGLVVPHGDPAYYTARPSIAVPRASLVAADSMFGLHPKMAPLKWLWDAQELAAVQAVGLPVPNRSHFSAMEQIEDSDPGSTARRGWVNRMIGLSPAPRPSDGIQLGSAVLPTSLSGPVPALAATSLDGLSLVGAEDDSTLSQRRRAQLDLVWGGNQDNALFDATRSARQTADELQTVSMTSTTSPTSPAYPTSGPAADLSLALRDTAKLIKADIGTELVSLDYGSWDMHADYGTTSLGDMTSMTAGFAAALNAFMRDLGTHRSRVTVVTISEFGRRVRENGTKGLEHGWGNMMLVAGAGVKGGKYYGTWPGLGTGTTVDTDLKVTTDYRNVLGEIVASRFPDRSLAQVFPSFSYKPLGVMSPATTPAVNVSRLRVAGRATTAPKTRPSPRRR